MLKSWAKNKGTAKDGLRPVVDFDSKKSLKSNGSNLTRSMGYIPDDSKTTTTTTTSAARKMEKKLEVREMYVSSTRLVSLKEGQMNRKAQDLRFQCTIYFVIVSLL